MNFPVAKLLETVRKNRETHVADFKEAEEDYRNLLLAKFKEKLATLESGNIPDLYFEFSAPRKHVEEYDQLISMLEFTSDKTITLEQRDFRRYVLDNWEWKEIFSSSMQTYKAALSAY